MRYPFKMEEEVGWLDPVHPFNIMEECTDYVNDGPWAETSFYRCVADWTSVFSIYKVTIFKTKMLRALFER